MSRPRLRTVTLDKELLELHNDIVRERLALAAENLRICESRMKARATSRRA